MIAIAGKITMIFGGSKKYQTMSGGLVGGYGVGTINRIIGAPHQEAQL